MKACFPVDMIVTYLDVKNLLNFICDTLILEIHMSHVVISEM